MLGHYTTGLQPDSPEGILKAPLNRGSVMAELRRTGVRSPSGTKGQTPPAAVERATEGTDLTPSFSGVARTTGCHRGFLENVWGRPVGGHQHDERYAGHGENPHEQPRDREPP
jgi:hypothetical protein